MANQAERSPNPDTRQQEGTTVLYDVNTYYGEIGRLTYGETTLFDSILLLYSNYSKEDCITIRLQCLLPYDLCCHLAC